MPLPALPVRLTVPVWVKRQRRILFVGGAVLFVGLAATFWRVSAAVAERLEQGVFSSTVAIYSGPWTVYPGAELTEEQFRGALRRSGYTDNPANPAGYFVRHSGAVEVHPGPASVLKQPVATIRFVNNRVASIVRQSDSREISRYTLDPQLITNLGGNTRERRRLLRFSGIPPVLVQALLSAEDRNFYSHHGFDLPRLVKAVMVNLSSGRKAQGGSTLTMQLSRNLWLGPEKSWRRKITELFFALTLEAKLSKDEILEHYCNQVYLGSYQSYQIHGLGEAAWRYFNRDAAQLNLPQAATLAGIIQRPNYFDPIRHPERALERRNLVLGLMLRNGFISAGAHEEAVRSPLGVAERLLDAGDAPYFVDLAIDEVQERLPELGEEPRSLRIYTTLDPDLQAKAVEGVRAGLERVDKNFAREHPELANRVRPQVALIALDPATGAVRAAVGGRSYGASQLNRCRAKRQPGSAFKPFVYAAALETQITPKAKTILTGATLIDDEPKVYQFGDEQYQPANFGQQYYGRISMRRAFMKSLNIPTVTIAELTGYKRVAELARRAGIQSPLKGTPAVALGAYEVTPVELAGAYTVFANKGLKSAPTFVAAVRSEDGPALYESKPKTEAALDPRIAWLMQNMMQDVMRGGTAGGVWSYGFNQPAAGKTGSSRDGWFAGFTRGLITVVWVGFDDNRDLELEGAKSALPVWAEFMKRATAGGAYGGPLDAPPSGLTSAEICDLTGELSCSACPKSRTEYFLAGHEPKEVCTAESVAAAEKVLEGVTEDPETGEATAPKRVAGEAATIRKGDNLGTAVWYRGKSGDDLVAAHPALPVGSRVKVTNLANSKWVIVRIDGRVPPSDAYIISLGQRAAQALDMMRSGSATVKVDPIP